MPVIPALWEGEAAEQQFQALPGQFSDFMRPCLKIKTKEMSGVATGFNPQHHQQIKHSTSKLFFSSILSQQQKANTMGIKY